MKEIFTVASVICASSLICTLFSNFITDGSMKKIVNLVLGVFMVCCLIMPIQSAVKGINFDVSHQKSVDNSISTNDELYSNSVMQQTKQNLENTLKSLLQQNNISINNCEIILAKTDNQSIIISSISIYINKSYIYQSDNITTIVKDNFKITPNIVTE